MEEITQLLLNNQSMFECVQSDQISIVNRLSDLYELFNKFDKQLDLVKPPLIIHINCKNLREERQIYNNIVLQYIYLKDIKLIRGNCNLLCKIDPILFFLYL
jgi:hypothetical protein